mgnify:CR=1 FL=1
MNYKLKCSHCKKKVTVSDKYADYIAAAKNANDTEPIKFLIFECPKCEKEIEVEKAEDYEKRIGKTIH